MKLTAISKNDIPKTNKDRKKKVLRFLEEFAAGDMKAACVDYSEYKTRCSAAGSLYASIRRFGITGIKVVTRGDKLYLVKED